MRRIKHKHGSNHISLGHLTTFTHDRNSKPPVPSWYRLWGDTSHHLRMKPTCILRSREASSQFCFLLTGTHLGDESPHPRTTAKPSKEQPSMFGYRVWLEARSSAQVDFLNQPTLTHLQQTQNPHPSSCPYIILTYNIGWYIIGASSVKSVSSISSIGPFHAFTPVLAHVTCASPRHETLIKYTERKFNLKSILEDVKKHAKKTQASKQKDNRYVYQLFGAPSGLFQSGFYKRFRGKDLGPCTKRSGQQEFVRSLNRW